MGFASARVGLAVDAALGSTTYGIKFCHKFT